MPVPIKVYDYTICVLRTAVRRARLSHTEELAAMRRLDDQARRLEGAASGPMVAAFMQRERQDSAAYGGRTRAGLVRAT
jgi:hypothetical protein